MLEAADADEALRLLARKPRIDLLFTDVVLPGAANGRELADKVRERYPAPAGALTPPAIRATPSCIRDGSTPTSAADKPYTQQDLARKIRDLLDARR